MMSADDAEKIEGRPGWQQQREREAPRHYAPCELDAAYVSGRG